jgi:hypothetical protein
MLCVGRLEVKGIFRTEELRKLRKLFGQSEIGKKKKAISNNRLYRKYE